MDGRGVGPAAVAVLDAVLARWGTTRRAKALLAWWAQTKKMHVDAALRGQRAEFDVLLVLA